MDNIRLNVTNLEPTLVLKSYSGKPGCMCGCRGKYSYCSTNVIEAGKERGYSIDINEISDIAVKRMISKMKKETPTTFLDTSNKLYDGLFIETDTRMNALYLKKGTIEKLINSGEITVLN